MSLWSKYSRAVMLGVAVVIVGVVLSACGSTPPKPSLSSGEIINIVKHDDVEKKVCAKGRTISKKVNGKTQTTRVCLKYKMVEVQPEWYEFELRSGNKTGWVSVDEETGESYQKGDQYP